MADHAEIRIDTVSAMLGKIDVAVVTGCAVDDLVHGRRVSLAVLLDDAAAIGREREVDIGIDLHRLVAYRIDVTQLQDDAMWGHAVLDRQMAIVGDLAQGDIALVNRVGHQQRCGDIDGEVVGIDAIGFLQNANDARTWVGEGGIRIGIARSGFRVGCAFDDRQFSG